MNAIRQFNAYDFFDLKTDYSEADYRQATEKKFKEIAQLDPQTMEGAQALRDYSVAHHLLRPYKVFGIGICCLDLQDTERYTNWVMNGFQGSLNETLETLLQEQYGFNHYDHHPVAKDLMAAMYQNAGLIDHYSDFEHNGFSLSYLPAQIVSTGRILSVLREAAGFYVHDSASDEKKQAYVESIERVKPFVIELQNRSDDEFNDDDISWHIREVAEKWGLEHCFYDESKMGLLSEILKLSHAKIVEEFGDQMGYYTWKTEKKSNTYGEDHIHRKDIEDRKTTTMAKVALVAFQQDHGLYQQHEYFVGKIWDMSASHIHIPECRQLVSLILTLGHDNQAEIGKIQESLEAIAESGASTKDDFRDAVVGRLQPQPVSVVSKFLERGRKFVMGGG